MRSALMGIAFATALLCPAARAADTAPHLDTSGVNLQPAYPATAIKNSESGAAVVGVNVNEAGTVNYVYPLQTSGFDDLDRAAIAGVLGWRFVAAVRDGKKVSGETAVEIAFQPPLPPGSSTPAGFPPPKPGGTFLPQTFQIDAKRGEYEQTVKPALCSDGSLQTTLEFLHPEGAITSAWRPAAGLSLRAEGKMKRSVALIMEGLDYTTPPRERFLLREHRGQQSGELAYSDSANFGKPVGVSLSWDSSGHVTAQVGAMEAHEAELGAAPQQVVFSMSSGAATFTNSVLVCRHAG